MTRLLTALVLLALAAQVALPATAMAETLHWQAWTYTTHERPAVSMTGGQARLVVPEDAAKPDGAKVELQLYRLPATTTTPGAPIVYLHGGPGGSSAEHLEQPAFRALFDTLRTRGDVILFDQRGCGASSPSLLPAGAPRAGAGALASRDAFLGYLTQVSTLVRDRLVKDGHDPRQYDVPASVRDLEAVRMALGAQRIHLLAHSYGTQLAQAYLREHPQSVARAVLIGPRGMDTSRKLPAEADAFLARIATLAAADSTVGGRFPDLRATLGRVLERLDRAPLAVEVKGPDSTFTVLVGGYALRFIVAKFYLNDPDNFRYLPKMLDEIDTGRRPWSLVFNLGTILRGGVSFAWFTTDAASGVTPSRAGLIAEQAKHALLGDAMNFPFPEIGGVWGMRDLGDAFRAPVRSVAPVLVVAGTLDGITPVAQGREVLRGFPAGRMLVVENGGHSSQLRAPGVATGIAAFLSGQAPPDTAVLPPVSFAPLVTPPQPK